MKIHITVGTNQLSSPVYMTRNGHFEELNWYLLNRMDEINYLAFVTTISVAFQTSEIDLPGFGSVSELNFTFKKKKKSWASLRMIYECYSDA